MERCSTGRFNPAKEHSHWYSRRICKRVCGADCRGCDPLDHQQANTAATLIAANVETLVRHYREYELPDIFHERLPDPGAADEEQKTYSTQYAYEMYLKSWILPRWRSYRLADVKAVDVEAWLKILPLARGTKAKIRNIMSALFSHAIRWDWAEKNPITSVRQSAKRYERRMCLHQRKSACSPSCPNLCALPRNWTRLQVYGEENSSDCSGRMWISTNLWSMFAAPWS